MNKKATIAVFAFVVLTSFLGYFIFSRGFIIPAPLSTITPPAENNQPPPPLIVQPWEIAGWKTYSNADYAISFQYPPDWRVEERKNPAGKGGESVLLTSPCIVGDVSYSDYFLCANIEIIAAPSGDIERNCPALNELYIKRLGSEDILIGGLDIPIVTYAQPPGEIVYKCTPVFSRDGFDFMVSGVFPKAENNPEEHLEKYLPTYGQVLSTLEFLR